MRKVITAINNNPIPTPSPTERPIVSLLELDDAAALVETSVPTAGVVVAARFAEEVAAVPVTGTSKVVIDEVTVDVPAE